MKKSIQGLKMLAGIVLIVCLSSFTIHPPKSDTTQVNRFRVRTIVIDAGHGGKDPGAHGSFSVEKNVALSIAKKLREAVNANLPQVKVVMTRSNDTFIPLNTRSQIANGANGNLFISIHCNSSPEGSHKQKGVMLLVYAIHRKGEQMEALRENASIYQEKNYKETYQSYDESDPANLIILNTYMQKYRKQSILFGDLLNREFKDTDKRESIGVKEQGVLVLAHSAMPAVLVETGFINNPVEEDYLNSATGQAEIVDSIVSAILEYKKEVER